MLCIAPSATKGHDCDPQPPSNFSPPSMCPCPEGTTRNMACVENCVNEYQTRMVLAEMLYCEDVTYCWDLFGSRSREATDIYQACISSATTPEKLAECQETYDRVSRSAASALADCLSSARKLHDDAVKTAEEEFANCVAACCQ